MKVAFFCGHSFGLRGTPGTYRLVEKMKSYAEILVFSPPQTNDCVFNSQLTPIIPLVTAKLKEDIECSLPILMSFKPDIIYLFNFPEWPDCLKILKASYAKAKYILDIKTPLLAHGERRKAIQKNGDEMHANLDGIVTLSKKSVESWIPGCTIEPVEYPLGIDIALFSPRRPSRNGTQYKRFVYIGTLHQKRKTILLIEGFSKFCAETNNKATLDIFGSGPEVGFLSDFIDNRGLNEIMKLKGLVRQDTLSSMLSGYDAGIAWVPRDIYNDSPSLKALEYMAAGIPVLATDTSAHQKLFSQGCWFKLFKDNSDSLASALSELVYDGFPEERVWANCEAVKQFDYGTIVRNWIIPVIERVSGNSVTGNMDNLATIADDDPQLICDEFKTKGRAHCRKRDRESLKIVFLAEMLAGGKGGAERVAMETADEMVKRGHLVYMAYHNRGELAYKPCNDVVMLPYDRLDVLSSQIRSINPDLFFVFYFNRKLIQFYSLVHGADIPFGIQECTNPLRLCQENWGGKEMNQHTSAWEREVIASAATRIRLTMPGYAQYFPKHIRPQVFTFSNPAFQQETLANPEGVRNQRKTILNVNGFKANKNLITLLHAFGQLAQTFPDWDIKVIGKTPDGGEPHKKAILNFIEENGLQARVLITGPTDDVYAHYADAQIHAISSLSEGCPTVVLEAMSVGLPSVGYADCPGTNELIRHDSNGILAACEDRVAGMTSALRRLMASPELRCRFGRKALEDSNAFEPKRIYDKWEQLFYEAAEYKNNPERLLREQMAIDLERAMHARRMREKLVRLARVS